MANIPRVPLDSLKPGERVLSGDAAHYLGRVLRLREGSGFVAFDPEARQEAPGTVLRSDGRALVVRLSGVLAAPEPDLPSIWLLQGLGKGDKADRVVSEATQLGARGVVWMETERSVPRLGERADARRERWRQLAVSAARQCGRCDVPEVLGPLPFAEALARPFAWRVLLHPQAPRPLSQRIAEWDALGDLAIAIGPEGGFSSTEVSHARDVGFATATLGPHVLRTETAAAAALGAVLACVPHPRENR